MTPAVRTIAVTLTAILLMHLGGMAVDPMALHAPPDEPAHHAVSHQAGHGEVSTGDLMAVQSAVSCIETEGVATSPRAPLTSMAFVAVMPAPAYWVLPQAEFSPHHWTPPRVDAAELRAFLQVFLN